MFGRILLCGISLVVLWIAHLEVARAQDAPPGPTSAPPRRVVEQAPGGDAAEGEQILMQLVIIEVRGDVPRALKEAGFRETAAGHRYVSPPGDGADQLATLLKTLALHAEIDILSRPQVRTLTGQAASIQVMQELPEQIPYLVRTGAKSFELRETGGGTNLGIAIQLTAQAADDAGQIEISSLKIATTTLDGRERIPGLDLEVGKPIISTRSLETTITVVDGPEVNGIAVPGPPGRQPVLFLSARRVKEKPSDATPNPLPGLFSPAARRPDRLDEPSPRPALPPTPAGNKRLKR
jgi:hypothetical protein